MAAAGSHPMDCVEMVVDHCYLADSTETTIMDAVMDIPLGCRENCLRIRGPAKSQKGLIGFCTMFGVSQSQSRRERLEHGTVGAKYIDRDRDPVSGLLWAEEKSRAGERQVR